MTGPSQRPRNVILSQLPENKYAALAKDLVPVELALAIAYEADADGLVCRTPELLHLAQSI